MKDERFYYKKDRLNQLRGFCAVVKNGSVNKASKTIGVEPTAISKQIKALENGLATKLFNRNLKQRSLKLTKTGEEFYKYAISALQNIDELFNYFYKEKENENSKEIKLAMHHTAINYLLPKYIEEFRKIDKNTKFIVYDIKTSEALEKLANGEIDIILTIIENVSSEFELIPLSTFKPIILVNKKNRLAIKKDNKITFEDLSRENMIMIDKKAISPFFISVCNEYNITGNIEFVNGNWETVRNFVKLNLGIHLYSEVYNKFEDFKDEELLTKNLEHLFPKMTFQIITKKGVILKKNIKNFIEIVKNKMKN